MHPVGIPPNSEFHANVPPPDVEATYDAAVTPMVVKKPPTYSAVPLPEPSSKVVIASTYPFAPGPSGDHDVPFQRAILFAATPPAVVNQPAAIRSPFGIVHSA